MATPFKRHGVSIFYFAAVVVTVFLITWPYFFNHQGSSEQIKSALSKLSLIHEVGEEVEVPVSHMPGLILIPLSCTSPAYAIAMKREFWNFGGFVSVG